MRPISAGSDTLRKDRT